MKQQTIFIDGLGLVEGHFSGVGQYILGIVRGLDQIIENAKYNGQPHPKVVVIIPRNTDAKFREYAFKNISYKVFPLSFRVMSALWYRGKMPPLDLWCGKGTYIFPRFVNMPLLFSKPSALVIYDLSYELYRQYSDEKNAQFLSKRVRESLKTTKKVITISDNARKELIDFYKLKPADVITATPATNPADFYRRSKTEIEAVKKIYGIKGDYILALSNLEPRKNLSALVKAYSRLPKEMTDKVGLLLVGVSGWKTEALFQDIVEHVKRDLNIMRPSEYVLDEHRPALISGAKFLVYPSHYEGFGMPPLEALACGVPVIAADNSSLPQAVGKAARFIKSDDDDALLAAVKDYVTDNEALSKKALIEGPAQAATFSWVESAQKFLDVAKELAE